MLYILIYRNKKYTCIYFLFIIFYLILTTKITRAFHRESERTLDLGLLPHCYRLPEAGMMKITCSL